MSKLDGRTLDIEDQNIKSIKELFPEVDTDGKIDFEKLKQVLGEYVDDSEERYKFTWNGKGEALRISQTSSMGTLRPAPEEGESKNWDNTENLYIEGDNLEVLKLLQKSYFGKIKMIYIDPPYNTGKDFVYKDNYKDNIKNYKKITGQVDNEGKTTTTNPEYSGRYHTDWLNMMYPRLRLARNLLTDDGVIFISIDDNEVNNLRKVCDEVFGEDNFLANVVRSTGATRAMAKNFDIRHDYVLAYCKNNKIIKLNELENKNVREYENLDNDTNGPWDSQDLTVRSGGFQYSIPSINGKEMFLRRWRYNEKELKGLMGYSENDEYTEIYKSANYISKKNWYTIGPFIFKGDTNIINHKKYGKNVLTMKNHTLPKNIGSNKSGGKLVRDMFQSNEDYFDKPKPVELLKYLSFIGSDSNSVILDFFAGSSTTAHAVMDLNAEDNGNRKFIMVQLPEPIDKESEAYKANYKNIAEIGKERIRRAGDKIKLELEEKYEKASEEERKNMKNPDQLDIGFKVFKLDSSNIKEWNPGKYENIQLAIEDSSNPYVEGRTEEDVVYEMMLKMGVDLTYPVEKHEVNGKIIYSIGFGYLMICLSDNIDSSIAQKMIKIKDEHNQNEFRTIFRDEGFKSDTDKTNVKETLKSAGLAEESFITL